ncbi:hypothetical protein [Sphingobium yanoikuyae]|uniref:hypothetical protein n=1 Tax=Sphingobium yanoikuyae TaxID=13690 RepID=UPI00067228A1|nr:hypothetical protein [Sphingobium yanoikuyae]KMW31986.1 hypothetical protein BV87_21070 [Sphingobium yanoikuyae]
MKKFTNYTPGTRGINTEAGTVWLDPGQSVEIDPKSIVGKVPDLGDKSDAASDADGPDAGDFDVLNQKVADLTKQVEALTTERDGLAKDKEDLTKQVEALTTERDGLAKDKEDLTKQVEALTKPADAKK